MFLYYIGLMSISTYWLSPNHLNSELGSSSSAANPVFIQPLQIQGVQGKTAYWGKGKWRTDT